MPKPFKVKRGFRGEQSNVSARLQRRGKQKLAVQVQWDAEDFEMDLSVGWRAPASMIDAMEEEAGALLKGLDESSPMPRTLDQSKEWLKSFLLGWAAAIDKIDAVLKEE